MRVLRLRLPDDLHRRLTVRARREGRSVNAVATEILEAAIDANSSDRRSRLRAAATAAGMTRDIEAPLVTGAERRGMLAATEGIGPQVDRLIADERDRS